MKPKMYDDLRDLQAARLLGLPGWRAYKLTAVRPDVTILEGAVCAAARP